MKRIAILGSGSGTNTENIIHYFKNVAQVKVALVLSNKSGAYVLERGRKAGIASVSFDPKKIHDDVPDLLKEHKIDFIVLAGFLKLIPGNILKAYHNRIINIHPALLPNFGGKEMYGNRVHEAVLKSGTIMSGITIHYVNDRFDEGEIIFQAACHVAKQDTVETLVHKVHELEYRYYPVVIEKLLY